jgi:hypothetical protein
MIALLTCNVIVDMIENNTAIIEIAKENSDRLGEIAKKVNIGRINSFLCQFLEHDQYYKQIMVQSVREHIKV